MLEDQTLKKTRTLLFPESTLLFVLVLWSTSRTGGNRTGEPQPLERDTFVALPWTPL